MIFILKWVLIAPATVYLAIIGIVYVFQRNLMYLPGHSVSSPADVHVPEMAILSLPTIDGLAIESWRAEAAPGKATVILFHGNAGTLADRAFKARVFMDAGYGVILAGYRGFGRNSGKPSEQGLYNDARAILSFLDTEATGIDDIILYGESLGSGVAVHMAHEIAGQKNERGRALKSRIQGVILEAPFTSMVDAAAHHYPWLPARALVWDRFDSIDKIENIDAPLLIIHGRRDRTVPFAQGEKLFATASEPKHAVWLPDASHVNVYDFGVAEHILAWLDGLAKNR